MWPWVKTRERWLTTKNGQNRLHNREVNQGLGSVLIHSQVYSKNACYIIGYSLDKLVQHVLIFFWKCYLAHRKASLGQKRDACRLFGWLGVVMSRFFECFL